MESPEIWSLLVSSLANHNLDEPAAAWAFVTRERLVRDSPGDRETFEKCIREEIERGPITGPSTPYRVAGALHQAGMVLPAGKVPDPWGKIAKEKLGQP